MITKSNFLVKFEGNKHLKKVFSEQIKPKVIVKTIELFEINSNYNFYDDFEKSKTVKTKNKLKINSFCTT